MDDEADAKITQQLVDKLKTKTKFVNLVCLVVNGQSPRLEASLVATIRSLEEILGKLFWEHCVLIFTRMQMDKKMQRRRAKANGKDDRTIAEE